MSYNRLIDLEVDLATLKRRLEALEVRFLGAVDDLGGPQPLFGLYSHLLLSGLQPTTEAAALMQGVALFLTPRNLLDLARLTGDMFPWRPFLASLDLLAVTGHDVEEATAWIEACAQDLLRAQGLQDLCLEDVLRSPVGPAQELRQHAYQNTGRRNSAFKEGT